SIGTSSEHSIDLESEISRVPSEVTNIRAHNRINHANQFVPRPVQLNIGRPNINSVRTNINTGRTNINYVRPGVNTVSTNVNTVRFRQPVPTRTSNSFSPKRPQVRIYQKSHDNRKKQASTDMRIRRIQASVKISQEKSKSVKDGQNKSNTKGQILKMFHFGPSTLTKVQKCLLHPYWAQESLMGLKTL
ncbi:hypothetical protein Tco_0095847, partial [Tanacetum coccineum]